METNDAIPFVSVILPTYNEERYIRTCIESLTAQTYPRTSMEWIIVDGDSTDNTRRIIDEFIDNYPIRLIVNKARTTPVSLNMGIQAARGEFIIRFDAHASFPPNYIEKCVVCLQTIEADNVGGWVETKAEGFVGKSISKMLSSKFGVGGSSFRTEQKSGFVDTVPFGAFRHEVFDSIGLFNEQLLRSEDNDINARIRDNGGGVYLCSEIHSIYYCRDSIPTVLQQGLQNGNALFRTLKISPKAMRLRHYVPFTFFLSLVALPVLSISFPLIKYLFLFEMASYFTIDFYYSFVKSDRLLGLITVWLFPLFHISYGIGSFLGLIGVEVY